MAGIKPPNAQGLTCFLSSAPTDSGIAQEVRESLYSFGVSVKTADDLTPGSGIASSLVDAVLSADFVCIVLAGASTSPAVWYTAGIATGSRRPVVVVSESSNAEQPPFNLFSAPIIRYSPGSLQVLRENLAVYIERVQPIAAQLKVNWDQLIDDRGSVEETNLNRAMLAALPPAEVRVLEYLRRQGALVAPQSVVGDSKRADALATLPTLGDEFNPIVIEFRNLPDQPQDTRHVLDYMAAARARIGMVVYTERTSEPWRFITTGPIGVIFISADELLRWDNRKLIINLARLRNNVVHSS